MRQVRRKTSDPTARPYLLKAKNEGLKLSWNQFENMLPQDGFARLGLACFECLQGPCRINPFSRTEERTVCGYTKDDLVYQGLFRLVSKHGELRAGFPAHLEEAGKEAAAVNESEAYTSSRVGALLKLAERQVARMKAVSEAVQGESKASQTREIGLGVLKADYVNVCLEEVPPVAMDLFRDLAAELQEEAVSRGAKGFNVVLSGDISSDYPFNVVGNQGSSEIAVLTGLLDLYVVGRGGLGLGRNVVSSYHSVYAEATSSTVKEEVKAWLVQAAVAYTKRDEAKILASNQLETVEVGLDLNLENLKAHFAQGTFKGICIIGGGSSVKLTEDELLYNATAAMAEEGVLCLTYGNAAVTLGKYGLLGDKGSSSVASALGRDKGAAAYAVGSEYEAYKLVELVQGIGALGVIALFPELVSARDLQVALSLAGAGVNVLTAIKLPVDGSEVIANEMGQLIQYAEPKAIVAKALAKIGR